MVACSPIVCTLIAPVAAHPAAGHRAGNTGPDRAAPLQISRMNQGRMRRLPRPLSVRTYMLGLILATLVPMLAFAAFLAIRSAQHEQALLAATVQDRTRAAARDIEQELAGLRAQLFAVANIGEKTQGDFEPLYHQAAAVLGSRGLAMVLSLPDGKEIFDTHRPLGAALPANPDPVALHEVDATGLSYISRDAVVAPGQAPVVMIDVPVMQAGHVAYIAGVDVTRRLQELVLHQHLPAGWIATISDRAGYTLARNLDPQLFIGQMGRPDFLRRVRDANEGWFPYPSREGIPLYIAFNHVNPMEWTIVVGIPLDVLYAPVQHSWHVLLLVGAGMLAVALAMALMIGHRISGPIHSLMSYAAAVGQGQPVPLRLTGLHETDAVSCSLHRASESLHRTMAEREQAAAALHASEERKQVLHQAVLAQENERTRIARELHDSLGQYLTALQLGLNAIGRRTRQDPAVADELARLRDLTSDIGGEVNRIAWELRPTALDDLGLEKAIAQYLEEWGERSCLQFDLQVDLGSRRLSQTVETTVYRALQEAITNVVRHAEAERVAVILEVVGRQLQLIVEDDGRGFPPDDDGGGGQGTLRLGLMGIRERLALVDGTLEVESAPGSGTTLFVRVPI